MYKDKIKKEKLPRHIAIIMDGNGRWAQKRGNRRIFGHKNAIAAVRDTVEAAAELKIDYLTLYAFSTENWSRPESEVSSLMSLFVTTITAEVKKLHKKNVRVQFIGDRTRFSEKLQASINESEALTRDNTGLHLNIAANYGGRWDILNAAQALSRKLVNGDIAENQITEEAFTRELCLVDLPEPDLFIRTGGEQRISNFLLWQIAYTELYFTDTLWPEFDDVAFDKALDWYASRQRRFGKTGEQVEGVQGRQAG